MKIHQFSVAVPTALLLALIPILAVQTGCESRTEDPATVVEVEAGAGSATHESVQKALAVAREMEATPDAAEDVLARHGLDLESFEELMYEISSDPQLSKAYNAELSRIEG